MPTGRPAANPVIALPDGLSSETLKRRVCAHAESIENVASIEAASATLMAAPTLAPTTASERGWTASVLRLVHSPTPR